LQQQKFLHNLHLATRMHDLLQLLQFLPLDHRIRPQKLVVEKTLTQRPRSLPAPHQHHLATAVVAPQRGQG
jgi:hypothetical protein